jgi:hypothetical protein
MLDVPLAMASTSIVPSGRNAPATSQSSNDMSTTIHTTGTHTITRADGSVSSVAFESTRTVGAVPPEVVVPVPPAGAHPDHELPRPPVRPDHTLPEPEPPEVVTGSRVVVIQLDGHEHVFHEDDGVNLGDYVGPHFTQRCICVTSTLPGFTVTFRPDADGSREEVVLELGAIWPSEPAANLGAYEAEIELPGHAAVLVSVPHHNWFGRWRWQSAPRPVVNNVADLIAAGLLPHYDASVGGGHTPPSQQRHYAGPMDLAGIEPYMPSTGGRDDIGMVTECQGDYLCTCSPEALSSLLAQLEGSGTLPWHYRDENTGAPLDTYQYPRASSYDPYNDAPDPYIPSQVGDGGGITLDTSHEPDLGYVPFLLTGDPYALEEMQFTVNYNMTCKTPSNRSNYNMSGALRAHAWALRCMARCAKVTPETTPQWLLPRVYFEMMLAGNRDFVAGYANSSETLFKNLNCLADPRWGSPPEQFIPPDCSNAPWWEDYEQAVMGHVVEMGFEDWRPNYEWKVRNIIDRCNGTSGWQRASAFPYKMAVRPTADAPFATDWADAWAMNCAMGNCTETEKDCIPAGDLSYPQQGLAALNIADRLGIDGARTARDWLAGEITRLSTAQSFVYHRWSIA